MGLENIELTPEEQEELKEQLNAWKQSVINKVEEELTEKYEQLEAALKEEYELKVEEIRDKMKKVFTKRFVNALKEMYEQIKAEVLAESYDSPEIRVLEEIKALVYPLINGSEAERYANEFVKMAEMNEELQEELEYIKGQKKLMELTEGLSPEVKKVVVSLVGEGTEEEVVERFAAIKQALEEAKKSEDDEDEEDKDFDELDLEDEDEDEEEDKKDKKKKKKKEEDEEEDEEEEEEVEEEDINIKSKTGDLIDEDEEEDVERKKFQEELNEMLRLAGIKK